MPDPVSGHGDLRVLHLVRLHQQGVPQLLLPLQLLRDGDAIEYLISTIRIKTPETLIRDNKCDLSAYTSMSTPVTTRLHCRCRVTAWAAARARPPAPPRWARCCPAPRPPPPSSPRTTSPCPGALINGRPRNITLLGIYIIMSCAKSLISNCILVCLPS